MNKKRVKSIEKLKDKLLMKESIDNLFGLSKPTYDIVKYLNNVGTMYKKDTNSLEKYLAVFTVWQNYFGEQLVIADGLKTIASSQSNYYYSIAVESSVGSINQKKELARSDEDYRDAVEVLNKADYLYNSLTMKFNNCDRAYKLVSRILTKRLNIKEFDV